MNEALKRAIRTFVQAAVGAILLQAGALTLDAADGLIDWNLWQRTSVTAAVAGVIAVCNYVQNWLENSGAVKPLLKE
jgi:hypothetical protein